MKIVNLLLGRGVGETEQASLHFAHMLEALGYEQQLITHPKSRINAVATNAGYHLTHIKNWGSWDCIAKHKLQQHIKSEKPDIVIAHDTVSLKLAHRAVGNVYPILAVQDTIPTKYHSLANVGITFLKENLSESAHYVPFPIVCERLPERGVYHDPLVLGAYGKFHHENGFHILIEAMRILKERGLVFRAILAGDGQEKDTLRAKITKANLDDMVESVGWVNNRKEFYSRIDMLCLPALKEKIPMLLLEAYAEGLPVVASDLPLYASIIENEADGITFPKGNADALANVLQRVIEDETFARRLAASAFVKCKSCYAKEPFKAHIEEIIHHTVRSFRAPK